MKRVYWIGLLIHTRALTIYLQKWTHKLPVSLRSDATSALVAMESLLAVLQEYDATHVRGKAVTP